MKTLAQVLRAVLAFTLAAGLVAGVAQAQSKDYTEEIANTQDLLSAATNPEDQQDARLRLTQLFYLQGQEDLSADDAELAVSNFQAALSVAQGTPEPISESHPAVADARYALGYTLAMQGSYYEAVPVLDQLVIANPDMPRGRYLLGVSLVRTGSEQNFARGMEVLRQLYNDAEGSVQQITANSATRLGYNFSTIDYVLNNVERALGTVDGITSAYGKDSGATPEENQLIAFAKGVYLQDLGRYDEAADAYQAVGMMNPAFTLQNGITNEQVAANVYYQSGLEALSDNNPDKALEMFENAEFMEEKDAVDIHHGKAVAYKMKGDAEKMVEELQAIQEKDPAYFGEINVGG